MLKNKNRSLLTKEQQAEKWQTYSILIENLNKENKTFSKKNVDWYLTKYPNKKTQVNEALQARQDLILNLEGFIVATATKYARKEIPVEDLIQVGREATIYAMSKFDSTKATKFSSYAAMWVRSKIAEAVKKSPLIPVPNYSGKQQYRFISESNSINAESFVSIYDRISQDEEPSFLEEILELISEQEKEILEKASTLKKGTLDLWGYKSQSDQIINKIKKALININ